MPYCVKCGAKLRDEAKFCTECGAPQKRNIDNMYADENNFNEFTEPVHKISQVDNYDVQVQDDIENTNSNFRKIPKILIIALITAGTITAGLGSYYVYMKNFNSTKIENNNISVPKIPKSNESEDISSEKNSDYIFQDSRNKELKDSQLQSLSKETLSLGRNEIFARHGYIFQTEPYKSYFNNKTWYMPDASFKGTDEELNETEKYNVKLILKYENNR